MNRLPKINIAWALGALIFSAALLFFKISLHSDSLFLDSLATDLFAHGGYWSDWKFSPAPAYFFDVILYFVSYFVFPDALWRIFFVSAAQVFILAACSVWLAKQLYPAGNKKITSTIILIVAFVTLVAAKSGMWLYFYSTNNHFSALVFSLVATGLVIRYFQNPRVLTALLILCIGAVVTVSTSIYLISFTIPAGIFLLGGYFVLKNLSGDHQYSIEKIKQLLIILLASYFLSCLLNYLFTYHDPLNGRLSFHVLGTLILFLRATVGAFLVDNFFTFMFSCFVLAVFLFLGYQVHRQYKIYSNDHVIYLKNSSLLTCGGVTLFLFIVVPVNVLGAIISGGFVDLAGYRYFAFPIALAIILAVITLDKLDIIKPWLWKLFDYALFFAIIVFGALHINNEVQLNKKSVSQMRAVDVHPVSICLSAIQKNGVVLKAGVADYWNARGVQYWFKDMHILVTTNKFFPHFWMSSIDPIVHPERYPNYNFAIVRDVSEPGVLNYTATTIGKLLPPPQRIYACDNAKAQIWFYSDDALDKAVRLSNSKFLLNNNK